MEEVSNDFISTASIDYVWYIVVLLLIMLVWQIIGVIKDIKKYNYKHNWHCDKPEEKEDKKD